MKLAAILALAACGSPSPPDESAAPREAQPADLLALIPAGADGVIVLDPALGVSPFDAPHGIVVRPGAATDPTGSFAAVRVSPALRAQLPGELVDLQWIALSLSPSRVLRGTAMFPTAEAAAKLAIDIGMLRKLAMTQVPAPIATALDKVAVTAWGPAITISATWTAADISALAAR